MKKLLTLLVSFILCFTQVSWGQAKIVDISQTYTYEQMQEDLYELQEKYPEIIKLSVIGESEYGRNIYEVKLGTGKPILHINASHHAREWISSTLTMKMLEELAIGYYQNENWDKYNVKEILDKTTISIVPMVNPDGVTLQQFGLEKFPESDHNQLISMNSGSLNFKRWKANAKGVDLNRQYDANWYSSSTPTKPSYSGFKGNKPGEAKEVVSLLNLIKKDNPEMVLSYHSSGEIIFWKFGQDDITEKRDYNYAKKLNEFTGYSLINSGYGIDDGKGFKDWFVEKTKKPGFTLELSPYVGETHVPLSNFSKIWDENKYVPLYLAEESYNLYNSRNNTTPPVESVPPKENVPPVETVINQKETTTTLNMRSGPSTNDKIVATLKKGTKVDVLESKNDWDKIKYGTQVGYANSKYLKTITVGEWINQADGTWIYMDPINKTKATGWKQLEGIWYYFDSSGVMKTGWQSLGGTWYYFDSSGVMKTGWQSLGGTWYYLDGSGAMKTGWQKLGGVWYYLDGSGAMKTGWQYLGVVWYYFYSNGAMATSTIIDGYKVDSNGAWVQ